MLSEQKTYLDIPVFFFPALPLLGLAPLPTHQEFFSGSSHCHGPRSLPTKYSFKYLRQGQSIISFSC